MFYVKQKLSVGAEINIEITDENVFNHCPRCGSEVLVDLDDVLGRSDCDLFSTAIYCDDCAAEIALEKKINKERGKVVQVW